jgi:hypothetical protein
MNRGISLALGALVVVLVGALIWRSGMSASSSRESAAHDAGAAASVSADVKTPLPEDTVFAGLALDAARPLEEAPLGSPLPSGAPKTVRFGVILVQYRGAEGAPASARSKDDASGLARTLAESAKADFKGTVSKGDPGSMDDAGRMPRGVLERTVEYTLFTLSPGTVSDPIDTPRGFWILRRIE